VKLTQKRKKVNNRNLCIGTGLVALDIILNGNPKTLSRLYTGGSCGNVLTILSFLGWETLPIARLANNRATEELENDLKRWRVRTQLITKTADGSTPIIIHRILKDKLGKPKHRFEFRDPDTGKWLPQYKPVLNKDVPSILENKRQPRFFYFDRINRASIELAKNFKSAGAIIFFEPSSIGSKMSLFEECLEVTDIIKF
jgi:fructokinase